MTTGEKLPVSNCLPDAIAALKNSRPVILKAPPGAGKSTLVPPAILDSGVTSEQQIILVQPRKVAARATASRIAKIRGSKLGAEIGYHVRFDKKASGETQLLAVTTGLLLRRLIADPLLESVGCVILDEFHERTLEMDLALGMIERIRRTFRPDLQVIIMSATLDPKPLLSFLENSVSLESHGKSFPVEIEYDEQFHRQPMDEKVFNCIVTQLSERIGDLLVFLPGVGEIRSVKKRLSSLHQTTGHPWGDIAIMELYGALPAEKQDRVLRPSKKRKVVLATNVAETSITIPGITTVIDTGLARVLNHDPNVGLPRLQIQPISKASADQRAGRAGRTGPGKCHRLWPIAMQSSRRAIDVPEVSRGDLTNVVLTLANLGEKDATDFPWLTPPTKQAIDLAQTLLGKLHAVDPSGKVTEIGSLMARLPITPRLARFMIEAKRRNIVRIASIAAALLSERDPFDNARGFNNAHQIIAESDLPTNEQNNNSSLNHSSSEVMLECDLWPRIQELLSFAQQKPNSVANTNAAKQVLKVAEQLEHEVQQISVEAEPPEAKIHSSIHLSTLLRQSLLAAFPDRLAKRRSQERKKQAKKDEAKGKDFASQHEPRGILSGGRGVRIHSGSEVQTSDFFLCLDLDSKGIEAKVRLATAVNLEWIDSTEFTEEDTFLFEKEKRAIVARRRIMTHDLVIRDVPITCEPSPRVAEKLFRAASDNLDQVMPSNDALRHFVARVKLLRIELPELGLTEIDNSVYLEILETLCRARTSWAQLRKAPWLDHIKGRIAYEKLRQIDQLAPEILDTPCGKSTPVHYEDSKPPRIEVRIQEIFGWQETPRIAGGKVAMQLHLLGPNYRPQQITDDLGNFWDVTYQHVRKELRRRYPKHHWPENPRSAVATPNGLKPKV